MVRTRVQLIDSKHAARANTALEALTAVDDRIISVNMQIAGTEERCVTTAEVNRNTVSINDV